MKTENFDTAISERISILRYLMIVGIVILHVPPPIPLAETGPGIFPFIKAFFSHAVFRSTVPVLTCISGYLLFKAGLDSNFFLLFRKKATRLVLPMFIWNFPLVFFLYIMQSQGLYCDYIVKAYPFDLLRWLNGTFGFIGIPANYPLFFLRDLFMLSLLTPVFGFMLRKIPWLGLAFISIFFWFNLDGYLIQRNIMSINFYIGGMAAVMKWDLKRIDRYAPLILFIFILICVLIVAFRFDDYRWIRLFSPFLVWPFFSMFCNNNIRKKIAGMAKHSYFIFLAHGPALAIVWLLYQKLFQNDYYLLFWLVAPVFVTLIFQSLHIALNRKLPKISRILLGNF